jgi:enoyl-CoA hydratase
VIDFELRDDFLLTFLNDPQTGNALSLSMAESLLGELSQKSPRALFLSQRGTRFCSGGNLRFYQGLSKKSDGIEVNNQIRDILEQIFHWPIPKLCFVDGPCLGGGVELISCFDHLLASPASFFGLWQRRIGLTFGWGGESRLLKRLSEQSLRSWRLHASTISAFQARDMGLIDGICPSSHGQSQGLAWLRQSLQWGQDQDLTQHLDWDQAADDLFSDLWMGPAHKKALNGFQ